MGDEAHEMSGGRGCNESFLFTHSDLLPFLLSLSLSPNFVVKKRKQHFFPKQNLGGRGAVTVHKTLICPWSHVKFPIP